MMMKKIGALLLAVTVLFCTVLLSGCGNNGEAAYSVKVLNAAGEPCTGVIVKFLQNGAQVAMQPVDANGVATKTLTKGDYTLELVYTDNSTTGYFDPAEAVLSADKTSLEIKLYNTVVGDGVDLFAGGKDYKAHYVTVGGTYVSVAKEVRNYFLFSPTEAGTYKISVSNQEMKLGYYGAPFFVQENSVEEVVDNTVTFSVSKSMIGEGNTGTAVYVLGIDGLAADGNCILSVIRTGEPEYNIADEPWTSYQPTHTPEPFSLTLGAGQELTYVDIKGKTEDNQVIYNESDGHYHFGTADGPVVYIHLGKGAPNLCLQTMIQGDGPMGGAPLRCYFFDAEGKFLKKEDYTDLMTPYFDNMDEDLKIYPLTKDLAYFVQNAGAGWWDETSPDYIFEGCNPEIGWMFALCYVS